jgi:hypothetical protein
MTPWLIRMIAGGALDEMQLNVMCGAAKPRKSPMLIVVVGLGKTRAEQVGQKQRDIT